MKRSNYSFLAVAFGGPAMLLALGGCPNPSVEATLNTMESRYLSANAQFAAETGETKVILEKSNETARVCNTLYQKATIGVNVTAGLPPYSYVWTSTPDVFDNCSYDSRKKSNASLVGVGLKPGVTYVFSVTIRDRNGAIQIVEGTVTADDVK